MRQISIRSLDVGYDLRSAGLTVALPPDIASVMHDDGEDIHGSIVDIAAGLITLGYVVEIEIIPPPGVQHRIGKSYASVSLSVYQRIAALMDERNTCTDARADDIDVEIEAAITA